MEKVDPNGSMYFNRVNPDPATQVRQINEERRKELEKAQALENCVCANVAHHGQK